ncbi:Hypp3846 [Branchiostoma lanceolatum]|uniref:Hypp3846 protein n=1 Tax=Branchiostoma lanceolatum TaxID=7740 RepID=A0A8K0A3L3_BRALA|nr:Hypp3846 [Branchiostoma lanceolatum]
MYQGHRAKTVQDKNMRDSCQANDNMYDQINEDEVYDPLGHDYSEIKDVRADASSAVDNGRTDGNVYNAVNEDEEYIPSGHVYNEIKDEDTNGEHKPVRFDSPGVDKEIIQSEYVNNTPEQATQDENFEDDGSVTFYAAAAEREGD